MERTYKVITLSDDFFGDCEKFIIKTKNKILNKFLSSNYSPLIPGFEKVISGESDFKEAKGCGFRVQVSKDITKIYDEHSKNKEYFEIATDELLNIMNEYEALMEAYEKNKLNY